MRTKYTSLIVAGALLATTFAGTVKSRGTAGATQLSVPVGAHGIALNGANLANVSGVDAPVSYTHLTLPTILLV